MCGKRYKHEYKIKRNEIQFDDYAESIGETRNSLLGIMTEDVYCADDFAMLTILLANRKNIDEC